MKKQTTTGRERFLLMLFPAALVLAIYSVFFAYPLQNQYARALGEYRVAQAAAPRPADVLMAKRQLADTREALRRLKAKLKTGQQRLQELGADWRNLDNRLETIQQVTELLRQYDLSVVFQGYVEEPAIPEYFQDLTQMIDRHSNQPPLEFWQIEVKGSYPDMTRFLTQLCEDRQDIVSLILSMSPIEEASTADKKWIIIFLI